jgi:hypothetical protein
MIRRSIAATLLAIGSAAVLHGADFAGKWEAMVTMPDGFQMKVGYTITAADGKFTGIVHTSEFGDFPMANLKVEGDTITFDLPTDDGNYAHKGVLGTDGIAMTVVAPQGPMPPIVFKRPAIDVTGKWRGKIQSPDGEADLLFALAMKDGKLGGTVTGPLGEAPLVNASVNGNEVAFDSNYQGYTVKRTGTIDGDTMRLVIKIEGYEIPATLKREPAPITPAAPAPAPATPPASPAPAPTG